MSNPDGLLGRLRDRFRRRRFLSGGMGFFLASFLFPPLLRTMITVRQVEKDGESKAPAKMAPKPGSKKKEIDPLFVPFINEKLVYEVNFLWTIKAAEVTVTLRRGVGDELLGELEAKALGVVGWATNTKRQMFKSRLVARDIAGARRLVATNFSRLSERGNRVQKTLHRFDYDKRKWTFTKYVNGARKGGSSKDIPADIPYYEDFVGFLYNMRAGTYGEMTPGRVIKIHTIPFKKIDEYTLRIATPEEMEKEKDWMAKAPGATRMGLIQIHQKIFGLKTGEGYVLADDKLVPLAGKIKDVVSFGDVSAVLTKRGKV